MNILDEGEPISDINVTPMLDLAYVLLIIFIILENDKTCIVFS